MCTQQLQPVCQTGIVGGNHASIASSSQILGREKAETTGGSERAGMFSSVLGTERLCSILDQRYVIFASHFEKRVEIRGESKKVDGENRTSFWRDRIGHQASTDVEVARFDVNQDQPGT